MGYNPQKKSQSTLCEGYHELLMLCCWFGLFLMKILESTQAETTKIII